MLRFAAEASSHGIPILRAVDDVHTRNRVLQQYGPAVVIAMGVRKNHIFHVLRVQSDFLQAIQDFVSCSAVEERLENDNALPADDGSCAKQRRWVIGRRPSAAKS